MPVQIFERLGRERTGKGQGAVQNSMYSIIFVSDHKIPATLNANYVKLYQKNRNDTSALPRFLPCNVVGCWRTRKIFI